MNEKPTYQVEVSKIARKIIRKLPKPLANRINRTIDDLGANPRPPGYKKLTGYDDLYRVRVGNLRVIYAIEDDALIILVLKVGPRGRVYRNLK